jgi:hypothetical protein
MGAVVVTDNLQTTQMSFLFANSMRGLTGRDHALQGGFTSNPLG